MNRVHLDLCKIVCIGLGVHTIALQRSRRSVRVSEMLTWTMRPPSSRQKTHSSAVRVPHNCSSPFWSPARRFAAPGRGSRCIERRVWESVFCSVCLRAGWGWSCAGRQTPRSETACVAAPARSPWRAASAGPRMTVGFLRTFCLFSRSLALGCPSPLRFFGLLSFSLRCVSVVCQALLRCYRGCPPGIPGNLARRASPLPRTSPSVRFGSYFLSAIRLQCVAHSRWARAPPRCRSNSGESLERSYSLEGAKFMRSPVIGQEYLRRKTQK